MPTAAGKKGWDDRSYIKNQIGWKKTLKKQSVLIENWALYITFVIIGHNVLYLLISMLLAFVQTKIPKTRFALTPEKIAFKFIYLGHQLI